MDAQQAKAMTEDDWKKKLTPEQYHVLREAGTEVPGSGQLLHNDATGEYSCAACGVVLFKSDEKYDSTTPGLIGWPSFGAAAQKDGVGEAVELREDDTLGMARTEAICTNCGSHLGHLFPDESSPTGQHFCINSVALDFKKAER